MERDAATAISDWNECLLPKDRHRKYDLMSLDIFRFYRGSNHLFWSDFMDDERLLSFGNVRTRTWLQGDMHAENIGSFENEIGELVYELNDFDDAVIADYQFDVWRMAVSLELVARKNQIAGGKAIDAFAKSYLKTMDSYAGNDDALETYFTVKRIRPERLKKFLGKVKANRTRAEMLRKWTNGDRFNLKLKTDPPPTITDRLAPISASEYGAIDGAMDAYGKTLHGNLVYAKDYFKIKDVAQRLLAGTGSTGTPRYYVLIEGDAKKKEDDYRILDVKRQSKPTAYAYFDESHQKEFDSCFPNAGARHAAAYRSMTSVRKEGTNTLIQADHHLGWMTFFGVEYSVRERSPQKRTYKTKKLDSVHKLEEMAQQWAEILATAHERASHNFEGPPKLDQLAMEVTDRTQGRHREFQDLVRHLAVDYADRVEKDYEAFKAALGS